LGDRYRAQKLLGQGGFGRTFLARDEQQPSQPACVIKQFYPLGQPITTKASELFEQEAIRLEELGHHDQIPELYAYFNQAGQQYIVQQYIAGKNLEQELALEGTFSEEKIRALLLDVLPILTFVHRQDVIHRDIKPENIIRRDRDRRLFLVDFGAAKYATQTALLKTGTIIGSAEYTAPEQLKGKATTVSDLYSLGVTCLYLLTGLSPFDLFDVHEDCWSWQRCLSSPISPNLTQILDRMVATSVKNRWQSSEDILAALKPQFQTLPATGGLIQLRTRIEYETLEKFLQKGNWRAADQETGQLLVQLAGRELWGWLRPRDIQKLPCTDLNRIDQLWLHYSQGRFGFSIQKQIYRHLGGSNKYQKKVWLRFARQVGWRRPWYFFRPWLRDRDLIYDLSAPLGHLPRQYNTIGQNWAGFWYSWVSVLWWTIVSLSARLDSCEFEAIAANQNQPILYSRSQL
jgi:serine/threonine protein kinase